MSLFLRGMASFLNPMTPNSNHSVVEEALVDQGDTEWNILLSACSKSKWKDILA
jgi:hypothetical protein